MARVGYKADVIDDFDDKSQIISTWLEVSCTRTVLMGKVGLVRLCMIVSCTCYIGWRSASARNIGMSMNILCLVKYVCYQ